jgi:F420-dependent oxidoreductase-like protein
MKYSIFLPSGFAQEFAGVADPVEAFEAVARVARAADETGFESLWVPDHLTTIPPSQEFVFEAWSMITALSRETRRIRLGQMVTGNSYRNPALQAKIASTVDVLSHGRLTFGIGAGWWEPDYVGYGYEFGTAGTRLAQLAEAVQIIRSMWVEEETTFEGKHYQVRGAVNQPKGVQRPHIPMLIAGGGEKVTLRLVARYAEACNIMESPEGLRRKYAILEEHCRDVGRDVDSIHRTSTTVCIVRESDEAARRRVPPGAEFAYPGDLAAYGLIGTVDTIRDRIAAYSDAGVNELAISFEDPLSEVQVREFAKEFID